MRAIDDQDEETARTIAREHMETARRLRLQPLRKSALQQRPADPNRPR